MLLNADSLASAAGSVSEVIVSVPPAVSGWLTVRLRRVIEDQPPATAGVLT